MKIKIICLLIICFFLTGCSSNQLAIDNMITPPNIDSQFNLMYNTLKETVGENIKLKYPINGENQGANFFINQSQALMFYQWSLKGFNDNNVRLNFLLKDKNEKWTSICDIVGASSEIDKVAVLTDDNDNKYIAIGYILDDNNQKLLELYNFDGEILNKIYSEYYLNFETFDFYNNKKDDIILTYKDKDDFLKTKILNINNMTVENGDIVNMCSEVNDYINVTKGNFNNNQKALFFDGKTKDDIISTQILMFENGKFINLMDNKNLFEKTFRDKRIYSVDYNNNGIIDVPSITHNLSIYDIKTISRNIGFFNWNNFFENTYNTSFVDISLGYIYNLPQKWIENNVNVKKTSELNEVVFFVKNGKTENQILKIRMYSNKDRNQIDFNNNQFLIKEKGQFFYVGEILINQDDDLFISQKQVIDNFYLYS